MIDAKKPDDEQPKIEQEAAKETKPKKAKVEKVKSILIKVQKDGAELEVDPSCLEAHKRAGWKEV